MNERIEKLIEQATKHYPATLGSGEFSTFDKEKFAELIVEECRNVVTEVYRKTPLELCGPLLTADEKIAEHFYRVEQ